MRRFFAIVLFAIAWVCAVPALAQEAGEQSRVFRVEGMTCALCSKAIDKAVRSVEGVRSVEIDREAEKVTVVADAAVAPDRLETAIEAAGAFEAELVQ
jgi:copper chaperone CopZ